MSFRVGTNALALICVCITSLASLAAAAVGASKQDQNKRPVTIQDLVALRDIDSLSVSPDGRSFAVLVRQADASSNTYHLVWSVGNVRGGAAKNVGAGGDYQFLTYANGLIGGELGGSFSRWSPDSEWIAYLLKMDGAIQLWRSRADGTLQQQVSHSEADVRDFAWSADGRSLFYSVGTPRSTLEARDEFERRHGIRVDEYTSFTEIVYPGLPTRPFEGNLRVRKVDADGLNDRAGTQDEEAQLASSQDSDYQWFFSTGTQVRPASKLAASSMPPIKRPDGTIAWFEKLDDADSSIYPVVRLQVLSPARNPSKPKLVACDHPECIGQFLRKAWWSKDEVLFWRVEGLNQQESGFYRWSPRSGRLRRVLLAQDDKITSCQLAAERLICLRESQARPRHVASIDTINGRLEVVLDVNPEFAQIERGATERIEWNLPPDNNHLGFPKRQRGYVIYPPRFDPKRKYPVFIAPYLAGGFPRGDLGDEQPLLVYAANDIIVINSEFPFESLATGESISSNTRRAYSPELGFPHLTMMMESTFQALDLVAAKGFIDESRVGIGGVSHGSFIPFWMLQQRDRLAAVSVGSPGFTTMEPYVATRAGRELRKEGGSDAWPESNDFWSQIDLADHVETIEAPILFQQADRELVFGSPRLFRRLDEHSLPYEAFVFGAEWHEKWQPAHREAIYTRNLDWFKFWLQDYEDPSPDKLDQYLRWRKLRSLQVANLRRLGLCERRVLQCTEGVMKSWGASDLPRP